MRDTVPGPNLQGFAGAAVSQGDMAGESTCQLALDRAHWPASL